MPGTFHNLRLPLATLLMALAATTVLAQDPQPIVTLRADAAVATTEVLLGQVADIQAGPEITARLQAISLSSSPLPDRTRAITAGYIRMRLRRFGFDPGQVDLRGETVVVRRTGTPEVAVEGARPEATSNQPALVRQGQLVDVEVRCGGVTVRTAGVACRDGAAGELIDLRLEKLNRTVPARVTGPGRATLMISGRKP
jgi:hypothetical protein